MQTDSGVVGKRQAVIVDIDGTLTHMGNRHPWDMAKVLEDRPNLPVIQTVHALVRSGLVVVYMTGRWERSRQDTVRWLQLHTAYPYEKLLMRDEEDNRQNWELKYELYQHHVAPTYDVQIVLDDQEEVVSMWRNDLGLPCFQVAPGI